ATGIDEFRRHPGADRIVLVLAILHVGTATQHEQRGNGGKRKGESGSHLAPLSMICRRVTRQRHDSTTERQGRGNPVLTVLRDNAAPASRSARWRARSSRGASRRAR